MSRYTIPAKDNRKYSCIVGHDNPLQTFFAIITDKEAVAYNTNLLREEETERPEEIFISGQRPSDVVTISELEKSIEQWAVIPDSIKERLVADQKNSTGPNAFQRSMIDMISKFEKEIFK